MMKTVRPSAARPPRMLKVSIIIVSLLFKPASIYLNDADNVETVLVDQSFLHSGFSKLRMMKTIRPSAARLPRMLKVSIIIVSLLFLTLNQIV